MSRIKKNNDPRTGFNHKMSGHLVFTTGVLVPSLLGISTLGDWRITKNKRRERWSWTKKKRKKRKKERKAAVAVTTTIFFLFCVKKNPYILRDHFEEDRCRLLWKESLIISRATDATC